MLVRRIARPLLAAPFVVLGVDALRHPEVRVDAARPVVEKVAAAADKQLPVQVPKDVEQLVRINAAVMTGAAVLFGLGRLPRLCALLLSGTTVTTTLARHRFWEQQDRAQRQAEQLHFLKNLGLVGGLLIAAVDTEGKPSVGYRARRAAKKAASATEKGFEKAQKRAAKAQKKAAKKAKKVTR
jgi:uncharacterized membrane protein YphA (DoxX/SURF4 family)